MIVCVYKGASSWTYYKRGNEWKNIPSLANFGPDDPQVATELGNEFTTLINEYEIKLEQPNGNYKARPQSTSNDITVTDVTGDGFKGFKHHVTVITATSFKINRVTIHGQVIKEITNEQLNTFTPTNKGGVFVYFTKNDADNNREKPLLICLSKDGTKSNQTEPGDNVWYKRKKESERNFIWQKDSGNTFESIKPGGEDGNQIDDGLKGKLDTISTEVIGDPGYKKPELVVKLDYVAKSDNNTNAIKYRTGDIQITVTPITGTNFKGYKHFVGNGNTINKVKIHNIDTEVTADLQNKQYVYVYYAASGDDDLQKPYLICLSQSGGKDSGNKWYERKKKKGSDGNTWENADSNFGSTDNPNEISRLETKLTPIKNAPGLKDAPGYPLSGSNDIDISVTPTNPESGKEALYGSGTSQINVSKTEGVAGGSNEVPPGYVRYKHEPKDKSTTTTFTLSSVKHNDKVLNGIGKTLNPKTLRITQRRLDKPLPESDIRELEG